MNALEANFKLNFSQEVSEKFMEQLNFDSEFLQQNNIIDYSMLFGIHKKSLKNVVNEKRNSSVNSYLLSSYSSFVPNCIDNVHKFLKYDMNLYIFFSV